MPTNQRTATLAEKRQELKKIGRLKSFTIPSKKDLEKAESIRIETEVIKDKLRDAELNLQLAEDNESYKEAMASLKGKEEKYRELFTKSTVLRRGLLKNIELLKKLLKKLDKDSEDYQERKTQIKGEIEVLKNKIKKLDKDSIEDHLYFDGILRNIAELNKREGITPLKVKVNKLKKKAKKAYDELNDLPSGTANIEDFFTGPGYYQIKQATSQQISYIGEIADFEKNGISLENVSSLKLLDAATADFLGYLTTTSSETCVSGGELLAIIEAKAYDEINLTPDIAIKVEMLANAYARCGIKGGVLMAEIGGNAEMSVGISGKVLSLNLKSYAKAKAGVYASLFGVMASAEAETGAELAGTVQIGKKDGKFSIALEAKAIAYGKAAAKAGLGLTGGKLTVGAVAGVQVGVKGSIGGKFFVEGIEVGGIAGEIDIAAEVCSIGAVVEGEFDFKQAFNDELDKIGKEIDAKESLVKSADPKIGTESAQQNMVEIKIGLLADAALLLGAKAKIDLIFNINLNSIKVLAKNVEKVVIAAIEKIFGEAIAQKFKEILTDIKVYASTVSDFKDKAQENILNSLRKGVITIQTSDNKKIKLELERQLSKLHKFKDQVNNLKISIEKAEVDNKGIVEITPEIQEKIDRFNNEIISLIDNGYRIDTDNSLKEYLVEKLTVYIERYDRRIEKLNDYVSIKLEDLFPIIEESCNEALDSISNYISATDKKDARKEINTKVKEVDKLLKTFDRLIQAKQEVIDSTNFHNNDKQLAGHDVLDLEQLISTKYKNLKDHIEDLKSKLTELQDIVKQEQN